MGLFGITFSKQPSLSTLPALWQVDLQASLYTEIQMRSIYSRILSEVLTRAHAVPDTFRHLLRSSMEGEGQKGLIEHIVGAMCTQAALVLKYEANILVVPEYGEKQKIIDAWKAGKKPPRTVMLSFAKYDKTPILRQYLHHKYLLLCTQHKALNLSSALQIKIDSLRKDVGLTDSSGPEEQAKKVATALLDGTPALLDAKDMIELLTPDVGPLQVVAEDVHSEISLILGLPISWVAGKQKVGLGDSGDADARAIERGLEPYFWESIHPAFQYLFGTSLKFKSENHQNLDSAVNAAQKLDLMSDDLVSLENKRLIVSRVLDVENDLKGKPREEVEVESEVVGAPALPGQKDPDDKKEAMIQ